jgi:hypothetical protein
MENQASIKDDLYCAFVASRIDNYISYSGIDIFDNNSKDNINIASNTDIESSIIQKDLINNLSLDSKFILKTIFESPKYIETPKNGNITKRSLNLFLIKKKWNPKRINRAFSEIKIYLKNL